MGEQSHSEEAEPTAEELAGIVEDVYQDSEIDRGSMGEADPGVVFAGMGEPLLRLDTLLETVAIVGEKQNAIPFRVNTSGVLVQSSFGKLGFSSSTEVVERLASSGQVAIGDCDSRRETLIQTFSVLLPCGNHKQFNELVQLQEDAQGLPPNAFGEVCGFISALVEAGVNVECTAVDRPGVNIEATRRLAFALGAREFRVRSYHP